MTECNLKVVFVCEHGAAKSVVAHALFNQMASELGLPARAVARGTDPDPVLMPTVIEGLSADRLTPGEITPRRLAPADLDGAALVVSFDQPVVAQTVDGRVAMESWDGLPLFSANYETARDAIRTRVRALVDSLATRTGG
jgi:arsenate reductase